VAMFGAHALKSWLAQAVSRCIDTAVLATRSAASGDVCLYRLWCFKPGRGPGRARRWRLLCWQALLLFSGEDCTRSR